MADEPFDPWQAVDDRGDLVVSHHAVAGLMGGGFYARVGSLALIVLDPELTGSERRAVLTHELIHHERDGPGPGPTPGPADLVAREEHAVEREVARRLVPADLLVAYLREATGIGDGVGPTEVATHFDVPLAVATAALEAVGRHGRR